MATIGSLSVLLTANAAIFAKGMKEAGGYVKDFGDVVTSTKALVVGALGAIGVGLSADAVKRWVGGAMEAIDANAKLSDRLNVSTESLVSLQHAAGLAGVSNELLTGSLEKMIKTLGGVDEDGISSAGAVEKLGLSTRALMTAKPDEAFIQIADRLAGMTDAYQRGTIATQIFGRAGQGLLPLLMSGAAGIRAARAEAAALGITYTRMDAAKVEAANDALTRLGESMQGVATTIAIKVAPFITALADKLTGVATAGGAARNAAADTFEWMVKGAAKAADYMELLKVGWYMMAGVAGTALHFVLIPLSAVIKALEWVENKVTGTKSYWGEYFEGLADAVGDNVGKAFENASAAAKRFESGANSKAAAAAFAALRADADRVARESVGMGKAKDQTKAMATAAKDAADQVKKIADEMERLKTDVATFGMSEGQKRLFDLKALGASPEQLKQAQGYVDQLTKLSKGKELKDAGAELTKSLLTPLEKYRTEITRFKELLAAKAITEQTYGRAVANARKEFDEATKKAPAVKSAETTLAATERRTAFTVPFQSTLAPPLNKIANTADRQLAESRKQTGHLATIAQSSGGQWIQLATVGGT